jgi:hypothetical protein
VKLTYRGPASLTSMFAQMLTDEGVDVSYEPPIERRSAGPDLVVVVLWVAEKVVSKAFDVSLDTLIDRAVARFKNRVPSADMTIERSDSSSDGAE